VNRLPYTAIAALYSPDLAEHRARARDVGIDCPDDVFEQLFHPPQMDPLLLVAVASVDWLDVRWREAELSGVALAQIGLPRSYDAAVQSARLSALKLGPEDERPEVLTAWEAAGTWPRPPVLVSGDLVGSEFSYQLLVGRTRLGVLIGLMERGDVPPDRRHRVWVGERQ
jgi:hypothetical protein